MVLRVQDKHFLWSLYVGTGMILVWKGISEGFYEIPYADPWIAFFIGLTLLTLSGMIFQQFDPLGDIKKETVDMINYVSTHPKKNDFKIIYSDKTLKKDIPIEGKLVRGLENDFLVVTNESGKQEFFIPLHLIKEVTEQDKTHWRM